MTGDVDAGQLIELRTVPKPQRHPIVHRAFDDLAVGESFVLVNDHEPLHLREEFERELAGSYRWEPLSPTDDGGFRVRISRTTQTPLPRVVADAANLLAATDLDASGAVWNLTPTRRDLDSNIIALPPQGTIERHDGPALDVLLVVLQGSGTLETEGDDVPLHAGQVVWLPQRSQRRFTAGAEGLRYLTVHHRKPTLNITAAPPSGDVPPRRTTSVSEVSRSR